MKRAAPDAGGTRETLSRYVSRRFGRKADAQNAHRVWQATGAVPPKERIDELHTRYFGEM